MAIWNVQCFTKNLKAFVKSPDAPTSCPIDGCQDWAVSGPDKATVQRRRSAGFQQFSTMGGSTLEAFTCPGAVIGCPVLYAMNTAGAGPVEIVSAQVSAANEVTVRFTADPKTDHKISLLWM